MTKSRKNGKKKEARTAHQAPQNQALEMTMVDHPEEKMALPLPAALMQGGFMNLSTPFLKSPLLKKFLPNLINLMKRPLMLIINEIINAQLKQAEVLLKSLYLVRSKIQEGSLLVIPIPDPVLQNELLDRVIYAANLELIYFTNLKTMLELLMEDFAEHGIQQFVENPSEMAKDLFNNLMPIMLLYDYLPNNKCSLLLVHPDSLWNKEFFSSFQANLEPEKIRETIITTMPWLKSQPKLHLFVQSVQGLRNEMMQIYGLLADKDRNLMQYCQANGYSDLELYRCNQACALSFFDAAEKHLIGQEDPDSTKASQIIATKKDQLRSTTNWVSFDSNEQYMSFFLSQTVQNSLSHHIDPQKIVILFFTELDLNLATLILMQVAKMDVAPLISKVFGIPVFSVVLLLGSHFIIPATDFIAKLSIAREKGSEETRQFLTSTFPFLKDLGSIQESRSLFQNLIQQNLPNLVKGSLSIGTTDFDTETKGEPDEFTKRIQNKEFTKKTALMAVEKDPTLFLLYAIKAYAVTFVMAYLNAMGKPAQKNSFFDIVPQKKQEQKALLQAALSWFAQDCSKAELLLQKLLQQRSPWNEGIIKELRDQESNSTAKNALTSYLEKHKKSVVVAHSLFESKTDARATETMPNAITGKRSNTIGPVSDTSSSVRASTASSASTCPTSTTGSSSSSSSSSSTSSPSFGLSSKLDQNRFFATVSSDYIDTLALSHMIQAFSAQVPSPMINAQCYALTLLALRFFQAYHLMPTTKLPLLSLDAAYKIRNALVHQHLDQSSMSHTGFIFDGKAEELMQFSRVLSKVLLSKNSNAEPLLADPLFQLLTTHGDLLAANYSAGKTEYVKFRQRIIYTNWLSGILKSFEALKKETQNLELREMLTFARAMLHILGKIYCLREADCNPVAAEAELAMSLRHSSATLHFQPTETEEHNETKTEQAKLG